jgi:hypothetical protein
MSDPYPTERPLAVPLGAVRSSMSFAGAIGDEMTCQRSSLIVIVAIAFSLLRIAIYGWKTRRVLCSA